MKFAATLPGLQIAPEDPLLQRYAGICRRLGMSELNVGASVNSIARALLQRHEELGRPMLLSEAREVVGEQLNGYGVALTDALATELGTAVEESLPGVREAQAEIRESLDLADWITAAKREGGLNEEEVKLATALAAHPEGREYLKTFRAWANGEDDGSEPPAIPESLSALVDEGLADPAAATPNPAPDTPRRESPMPVDTVTTDLDTARKRVELSKRVADPLYSAKTAEGDLFRAETDAMYEQVYGGHEAPEGRSQVFTLPEQGNG